MISELCATSARFRAAGMRPSHALAASRTLLAFKDAEEHGVVRLRADPEEESYFDAHGKPEGYVNVHGRHASAKEEEEEICRQIELYGFWWIVAEVQCPCCKQWEHADSIGMCTGYADPLSPYENCYVTDLMQNALTALHAERKDVLCLSQ